MRTTTETPTPCGVNERLVEFVETIELYPPNEEYRRMNLLTIAQRVALSVGVKKV